MAAPTLSGIYVIRNTVNGKLYVGSAINLPNRWLHHRKSLRTGKHHSVVLQRAWKKHGEHAFVFEVIELVPDIYTLVQREQHWIDFHRSAERSGYNVCPKAGSSLGRKASPEHRARLRVIFSTPEARATNSARQLGRKASPERQAAHHATLQTPECRARLRAAQLGRKATLAAIEANRIGQTGRKHSEATKEKMRLASRGFRHSEETKQKLSEARKGKPRKFRTPEDKIAARERWLAFNYGRHFSAETRAKISEGNTGKRPLRSLERRAELRTKLSLLRRKKPATANI